GLHRLAHVLARKGDTEGAMAAATKIITLEPREPKTYLTMGDVYIQARRYQEALARYREGYQLQPDFDDFLLLTRIANVERLMLNFSQSRRELESYADRASPLGRAYGWFLLGDLAFFTGDFNQAVQQYQGSVAAFQQLQQPNPGVHVAVRLAELLAFQDRYDEALSWVDQAEAMATSVPLRFVARRNRIVILAKKGDWRKAEAEIEKLEQEMASLPPEPWRQGWMVYCRAQIELAKGQLSEAKLLMSQAASDIGRPADLGILLARQGQYPEALEQLNTALHEYESLALDPSYAVWRPAPFYYVLAYYQRAKTYREVGQVDKARQDFQKFVAFWSGASHRPEVIESTRILQQGSNDRKSTSDHKSR
ncbi:MAG: tetratricopeptide repeat protein, partial [Candidatus Binatia bacterium]